MDYSEILNEELNIAITVTPMKLPEGIFFSAEITEGRYFLCKIHCDRFFNHARDAVAYAIEVAKKHLPDHLDYREMSSSERRAARRKGKKPGYFTPNHPFTRRAKA